MFEQINFTNLDTIPFDTPFTSILNACLILKAKTGHNFIIE